MSKQNLREQLASCLHGQASAETTREIVEQLRVDDQLRREALQDLEVDGLLRAAAFDRNGQADQFTLSVLDQLQRERMLWRTAEAVDGDAIADSSISAAKETTSPATASPSLAPQLNVVNRLDSGRASSNMRLWRILVAPLAAVTLFAAVLTLIVEQRRVANQDVSQAVSPSESGATTVESPSQATGADQNADQSDNRIDLVIGSQSTSEEIDPGRLSGAAGDRVGLDRETDRYAGVSEPASRAGGDVAAELRIAEAGNENDRDAVVQDVEPALAIGPHARLLNSTPDARWYRRPDASHSQESLSLLSGTAVLKLGSDVEVSVDGPADFAIDTDNSLLLVRGRVSATVPSQAIGFTIDTPPARIVDLGTRFDVDVSSLETASVRVHEGEVRVESVSESDEAGQSWTLLRGNEAFVDVDGAVFDWRVGVKANVFGEISVTVNGQDVPIRDADALDHLIDQPAFASVAQSDQVIRKGRYVFNNSVQDLESMKAGEAVEFIESQFDGLADLMRRGTSDAGAYRVRDTQFPYSGLQDQLAVRRRIARIYGVRILGGRFSSHERFETVAGSLDELRQLQRELRARLDFVNVPDTRASSKRDPLTMDVKVAAPEVSRDETKAGGADASLVPFESENRANRGDLMQRLDDLRRRKDVRGNDAKPRESIDSRLPSNRDRAEDPDREASPTHVSRHEPSSDQRMKGEREADAPTKRRDLVLARLKASQLVEAALKAELRGDQDERRRALEEALSKDSGNRNANWQSGRMLVGKEWLDIEDAQAKAKASPVLAAYERIRESKAGSSGGTLDLARWCRSRRPQASQMYYTRLLDNPQVTNPSVRREAINSLELVNYRGSLMPREEMARLQDRERRFEHANRVWTSSLQKWTKWLRPQSRDEHRQSAIEEMEQVDDPDIALVALQFTGVGSEEFGLQRVKMFDRFSTPESTLCLASEGVRAMWPSVWNASAESLQDRKMHDYVPQLLGSLVGMTESDGMVKRGLDGRIQFEHVFRQEGATTDREQRTRREALPRISFRPRIYQTFLGLGQNWDPNERTRRLPDLVTATGEAERIERMFQTELDRREASAERANAMAKYSNDRIYRLLSETTGEELAYDNDAWWNWWQDHNYIDFQKSEQTYVDQDSFVYAAIDAGPRFQQRHSCFAAGTVVATETGMQPVEEIVAGDRVLSKDVDSGELKFQTVVLTTLRPPTSLLKLTINDEEILATPGHPFWVAGKGWKMAKFLKAGDQLHGLRGVVHLENVEPVLDPQPVHNLIVAEFGNYFVGENLSLVHDNTFRRPTPSLIPGLRVASRE